MIKIEIKGLQETLSYLGGLSSTVKKATADSLNDAARAAYGATRSEMRRVFERPTPWVLGGVSYRKATEDNLVATVGFSLDGNKSGVRVEQVLKAEMEGGMRRHKRHEVALRRAGILPPGMFIVPGQAAKLDTHGNMAGSQIVQIMSWFAAHGESGYRANMRAAGRKRLGKDKKDGSRGFQYFVIRERWGKLPPGIYQRFAFGFGSATKPVMIFVRGATYRARFDFYGVAEQAAREEFNTAFARRMARLTRR